MKSVVFLVIKLQPCSGTATRFHYLTQIWGGYSEEWVILGTFGVILGDLTHYIQGINSIDTICENSAQTKTLLSKGNTSDCY